MNDPEEQPLEPVLIRRHSDSCYRYEKFSQRLLRTMFIFPNCLQNIWLPCKEAANKKWILPHCVYLALTSANKMFFPLPLPVRIAMAFYNFFLLSRNTSNRFLYQITLASGFWDFWWDYYAPYSPPVDQYLNFAKSS